MSSTQIYSKKTNAELISLTSDVVANKALYDARVIAVDASLNDVRQEAIENLSQLEFYFEGKHSIIDASFSAVEAQAVADKAEVIALVDAEKARIALRESAVDASLSAVDAKIDTEKAELQANIDALASSSSGASGALTSRVDDLEAKVGADLTATINTALSDGVVQATLDGFLAKDTELASALTTAIGERTSADDAIKAKFNSLVDTLFEGLTFEGVAKADLQF